MDEKLNTRDRMFKDELIETFRQIMERKYPDINVILQPANKINSVEKESITFLSKAGKAMMAMPVIYINDLLDKVNQGREYTVLDVAEQMVQLFEQSASEKIIKEVQQRIENVEREKIVPEVINRMLNEEFLANTPHRVIADDLAVIARYELTDNGTAVVSKEMATKLCMTPTEVLDIAISNTKGNIQSMAEIMASLMGITGEEAKTMMGDNGMYVVTNANKVYGAATIFLDSELRKEAAQIIGGDFFILPSSIHECICISADMITPKEANDMIAEVNAGELLPEEVLSNHCYHVNAQTLKITNPLSEKESEKKVDKAMACM